MQLAPVRSEVRISGFRADLVGALEGRELIIEVKVTHSCSYEKIRAYRDLNLSVLEIDLAPFRYATANELREAMLKRATRYWLCLSGGRKVPQRPDPAKLSGSDRSSSGKGLARPKHVPQREWAEMSTLEKVQAVDPDGRLTIKNRGYGG